MQQLFACLVSIVLYMCKKVVTLLTDVALTIESGWFGLDLVFNL